MDQHCSFSISLALAFGIILMCIFQISAEITCGKATRRLNLDNKIQDFRTLWQSNKRKMPLCLGECVHDDRCASLFYNKVTGQCQGHSITFGHPSSTSDMQDFRYYVRDYGKQYIGDFCATNDDCLTLNAECRTEMCQCIPGYSFSPRTHDCRTCSKYGNDFWEIRDYYISQRNVETFNDMTIEACFRMCINRTSYTCVSLEYGRTSGVCYLSNITVLDVPDRWYHDTALTFNISYYQRDCDDWTFMFPCEFLSFFSQFIIYSETMNKNYKLNVRYKNGKEYEYNVKKKTLSCGNY